MIEPDRNNPVTSLTDATLAVVVADRILRPTLFVVLVSTGLELAGAF